MMQALFGLVVNGATLFITANSAAFTAANGSALIATDYLGFGVGATGLAIETIADW